MKILTLVSTLILTLLMVLTFVSNTEAGRPATDPVYGIESTKLNDTTSFHWPICLDGATGSDTLFGWDRTNNQLDYYDGSAWQLALDLSAHPGAVNNMRRIYIDENGNIFFSFVYYGKLYKVTRAPYALADSLAFVKDSDFMYMGEDKTANVLYVGEYADLGDTSAHIWKSADAGANWSHIYHDANADHVHGLWPDPYRSGTVYAALGDGLSHSSLIKSTDSGANWSAILDSDVRSQATAMLFLHDTRIFGMDCRASDRDSTGIFQTTDDAVFTDVMDLVSPYDSQIFVMSLDADSIAFAATYGRNNGESDNIAIYRRRTDGTWWRVKLLGTSTGTGIWDMTEFGSDGYAYYSDRLNSGVWKFRDTDRHTVGTGGRYATIALGLAGTATGDTLVLLTGSHTLSDATVHHNMTVMGTTGDRDDVTVMCVGGAHDGFIADSTAVFRDFTLRNTTAFDTYHYGIDCDFSTADVTSDNVRFAGMSGALGMLGFSNTNNPNAVRYRNCAFDSCSQTQDGFGAVYIKDPAVFIARDCTFRNNVTKRAVLSINQTADGDGGVADTLLVIECLFTGNRARQDRGGALLMEIGATCEQHSIEHCTFDNNECKNAPADGQVFVGGAGVGGELYHCIITGADSTNAIRDANNEFLKIEHCNAWGNLDNWFSKGWASGEAGASATDTIHVDPIYNCFSFDDTCYAAKAGKCRNTTDASYMGWLEYTPPDVPSAVPPTVNPALYQDAFYQDLYASSDTVCCHASHWDMIVPDLMYAGDWSVFPYGAKSKLADGINVKVTRADSESGWSETYFVPVSYKIAVHWKNEFTLEQLFKTAVDTVAVQAVFSTCAADSVIQYQFIMEGW